MSFQTINEDRNAKKRTSISGKAAQVCIIDN